MRLPQVVVLCLAALHSAEPAAIIVGTNTNPNGIPFNRLPDQLAPGTRYQQAYAANLFSSLGQMEITAISFLRSGVDEGLRAQNVEIYFSTIATHINSLSDSNFDFNLGSDAVLFGTASLSGSAPAKLTFTGVPFSYDPAAGNLLVDMRFSNIDNGTNNDGNFQEDTTYELDTANAIFSRYHNFGTGTLGRGLVTEFQYGVVAIPEPTTWIVVNLSLALFWAARRNSSSGPAS